MTALPRYDWRRTYQWNYEHAPDPLQLPETEVPGSWTYLGRVVGSPLGIAAGPLLNGRWCLYYASLGFDVVTYKTVRSSPRACYPLPNLQPVECRILNGGEKNLPASDEFRGSWAVSFGMPSQAPAIWQADIAETRRLLPKNKLLNVSVVGTMQPGWSIEQLADDYAACAARAAESGADSIEFNLSCPNVTTCDGQLYQRPSAASIVAERVKRAAPLRPVIAKIGYFRSENDVGSMLDALAIHVEGVAGVNCIGTRVIAKDGRPLFDGDARGIAGAAILDPSLRQTEAIAEYVTRHDLKLRIIGVGGISTATHVRQYIDAGAETVQLATAAMTDPEVGCRIRFQLSNQLNGDR
jgi:dihydroorotate dehydrogenase (NAD+) catalytic subunit